MSGTLLEIALDAAVPETADPEAAEPKPQDFLDFLISIL